MNIIKKINVLLLTLCAVFALAAIPAAAAENNQIDPILILSPQTTLTVAVDGEISTSLSGEYPYGETASVTAPSVAEKTFLYWTNGSGEVISYAQTLSMNMYANTSIGAVYGDSAAEAASLAAFTSISRHGDQISFCGIGYAASGDVTDCGVLYSTTATTLSELQELSPDEAIERAGNVWTLLVTPEDDDTTYYAAAYAVAGGETCYSEVKTVKFSELENGVSLVANLGDNEQLNSSDNLCRVTFDPNGGGGTMPPQGMTKGVKTTMNANTYTNEQPFRGWNTKADGTGTAYADQAEVTFTADTTLYAQWKPKASVTSTPEAKTGLVYSGTAQELVSAGTMTGGTMQYALATQDGANPAGKDYGAAVPTGTNAGTYYVWYKVLDVDNLPVGDPDSVTVTIAPKEVGLSWANTKFNYDGKSHAPTATATGLANGDTCTVTVDGAQTQIGSYTATAAKLSNANYKLPANVTQSFTIEKAPEKPSQKAPSAPVVTAMTGTSITVKAVKGQQYSIDGGKTWQKGGTFKNLTPGKQYTVVTRKAATSTATASPKSAGTKAKTLSNAMLLRSGLKIQEKGKKITVTVGKVPGATSYEVYVQYCGSKVFSKNPTVVIKNGKTSTTISKINDKTIDSSKPYKVRVVAKKGNTVLATTPVVHGAGSSSQYTDVKSLKLNKSAVTLTKGKTFKVKATQTLVNSKKKALPNTHDASLRFLSSDSSVATVDKNGKITARGPGQCVITVTARNGLTKNLTVTVK